jgi:hypothetical protein
MKFPNHISLDVKNSSVLNSNQYWLINYLRDWDSTALSFKQFYISKRFLSKKKNLLLNDLIKNQKKFTLVILYSNFSKKTYKSKKTILASKSTFKDVLVLPKNFNGNTVKFKATFKFLVQAKIANRTNKLWSLFNINFLKKERIYTKLKYSRTPQYDIVSGGSAALLAGFLGFLITEKFGFELIDSGDFYFLFMYIVFVSFFGRILFRLMSQLKPSWSSISLKWLFFYYQNIYLLAVKYVKLLISR